MCSHVARISIHIIGFTLTPLFFFSSSLAFIHNHGVSDHFLLAEPPSLFFNKAYGRYYEI